MPGEYRNHGDRPPFPPSRRPDVFADPGAIRHILERHARGGTGTQKPASWTDRDLLEAVDEVLRDPATVRVRGAFLSFFGTVDDVWFFVQLRRRDHRIRTAHPIAGPGVRRNGRIVSLPADAYAGVRWSHER